MQGSTTCYHDHDRVHVAWLYIYSSTGQISVKSKLEFLACHLAIVAHRPLGPSSGVEERHGHDHGHDHDPRRTSMSLPPCAFASYERDPVCGGLEEEMVD